MSGIVKVVELISESPNSWEEAASTAVARASKTLHGIRSVYIKDFEAIVDNDKIVNYRVIAKVSFVLD
jgi:flavin-binding protein dodecin